MSENTQSGKSVLYIGIDCAPGAIRPDAYIAKALKIFDIVDVPGVDSMLFGAWKWNVPCDLTQEDYDLRSETLVDYFNDLYVNNYIRGAEWCFTENGADNNDN